jgi:hypothetical protein
MNRPLHTKTALGALALALFVSACGSTENSAPRTKNDALISPEVLSDLAQIAGASATTTTSPSSGRDEALRAADNGGSGSDDQQALDAMATAEEAIANGGVQAQGLKPGTDETNAMDRFLSRLGGVIDSMSESPTSTPSKSSDTRGNCTIRVEANVMTPCSPFIDGFWRLKFADGRQVSVRSAPNAINAMAPGQETLNIAKWASVAKVERFIGGIFLRSGVYALFDIPVGDSTPLCPYSFKAVVIPNFVDEPISPAGVDGRIEVEKCDEDVARKMWATSTTSPTTAAPTTIPPTTVPKPVTTSIVTTTSTSTSTTTSTTSTTTTTTIPITTLAPKPTTTVPPATTTTTPKTCVLVRTKTSLTMCKRVSSVSYEWRASGQSVGSPVYQSFGGGWTLTQGTSAVNLASRPIPSSATSLIIRATLVDGSKLAKTEVRFGLLTTSVAVGFFE